MSTAISTPEQARDLVDPLVADAGYDVEDVTLKPAPDGGTAVTIVVDRDGGADLDALATLTRLLVETFDSAAPDADYTLEVTTPGIGRPLTAPRHWYRARGRKVEVDVDGPGGERRRVSGRIGVVDDAGVELVSNVRGRFARTHVDFEAVAQAVVQVDFRPPNRTELEMCGLPPAEIARLTDTAAP